MSGVSRWIRSLVVGLALFIAGSVLAEPGSVSVRGELEVVIADDFLQGESRTFYFVREQASGRTFELRFAQPPGHLKHGQPVNLHGRARGSVFEVEQLEALEGEGSGSAEDGALTSGERHAVVMMVDLQDASASARYTMEQVDDAMWTAVRSLDGLYQAASWDQLAFPDDTDLDGFVDSFGPYAIPHSASSCDYYDWAAAADAAASADGVDLSLYRHRVYILPRYNDIACSWAGLANVGCGSFCRSWIAEAESPMVYVHELGHNLGMGHASTDPENDGVENVEYGDASDPMGSSRKWHVFNAAHADQMGWFDAYPGTLLATASTGVFDLFPLAVHPLDVGGLRALKVAKPGTNESYYFSYRQPVGYDDSLSSPYTEGVSVHRYTSGSAHTHYVTTLADGGQFEDPASGLTLTQLGRASDASYVSVELAFGCVASPPSVSVSPSSRSALPGASLDFDVLVTNQDSSSCAAAGFALAANLPAGLAGQLGASALQLAPGTTGSTTLQVTAAGEGRYDFSVDASHGSGSASATGTAVADATPPSAPTLTGSVKRKTQVRLSWSGAADGSGSGVSSYRLHREGGPEGPTDLAVSGTSYTDQNTTSGATYAYTVHALDAVGNESGASNVVSLTLGGKSGGPGGGGGGPGGGQGGGKGKKK